MKAKLKKELRQNGFSDTNVRELYCKNYTIVYEICGDDIIIHEVYNSAKLSGQLRGW